MYNPDFDVGKYYCLHCTLSPRSQYGRMMTHQGITEHLFKDHDLEKGSGVMGKDFVMGRQAQIIWGQRQREAEELADQFGEWIRKQPTYTVEDFLIDFKAASDD